MFYRILVCYDGSELAKKGLNAAIELSKLESSSRVEVIHVYQYAYFVVGDGLFTPNVQQTMDCTNRAQAVVDEAAEILKAASCKGSVCMVEGLSAKSILKYADESNCDLIVMGSRGLSGLSELVLGSVSHNVVQHAKVPVMIVK